MRRIRLIVGVLALLVAASAARPLSGAQAGERCFDVPGVTACIAGRFREYWEQNGALPVFGYPISAAAPEQTPDGTFLTQYFERNRFEHHPEQPRPYDVLLGRLGDARLRQQDRDWRSFPVGRPDAGCLWFAQTGHAVCDQATGLGFKSYWQAHGLLDPSLDAYGKSLALFGLPLSEARVERNSSGADVITQWFERARFEWHSDQPADYRVLLGLLGTEIRATPPLASPTPVPPGGAGAASGLGAETTCSEVEPRNAIALLRWQPSASRGNAQQVEVTIYRDGFDRGAFERSPLLPPDQAELVWQRLSPGIIHYWRVITTRPQGAVASEPASFVAPTCVADYQPTPESGD